MSKCFFPSIAKGIPLSLLEQLFNCGWCLSIYHKKFEKGQGGGEMHCCHGNALIGSLTKGGTLMGQLLGILQTVSGKATVCECGSQLGRLGSLCKQVGDFGK